MEGKIQDISKERLETLLKQWGGSHITSEYLHKWMDENYFPLHQKIGNGEPVHTQKAMNIILNEIELTNPNAMNPDQFQYALNYLNTTENQYDTNKSLFISKCFSE